jgi:hypothetical protein
VTSVLLSDRSKSLSFPLTSETNIEIDLDALFEPTLVMLTETKIEEITEEDAKEKLRKSRRAYRWARRVSGSTVEVCVDRDVEKRIVDEGW